MSTGGGAGTEGPGGKRGPVSTAPTGTDKRPALWWDARGDGRIACQLCPHSCVIKDSHPGICGVRFNRGGTLEIPYYGMTSNVSMDPIEKKPLYHYHPGEQILSVGFVGCTFRCGFCQNWHISQGRDARTRYMSPRALVDAAKRERSFGIAYTYSEPTVHAEYVVDTAAIARSDGLKNVLVSNGFLKEAPAAEVLALMDAVNIDLKGFNESFYREETGGRLKEVQRFISQAAGLTHLELTTLVIPGKNDNPREIEEMSAWIASLRKDIPLHLSAYHPEYKYTIPTTSADSLRELALVARRHLTWVYVGNVSPEVSQTICTSCGNVLVNRKGWTVQTSGLRGTMCAKCGTPSPIVVS